MFQGVLRTEAELRGIIPPPNGRAVDKEIDRLDEHCRTFIAHSPFVLLGTSAPDGSCDVSPKGGPPGFVRVLDDRRVAIPDAPGSRRADSHTNILANGNAGLLFLIPGFGETLRIAGRACLTTDPALLEELSMADGRLPALAIGVEVESAYLHCAKAMRRSGIWEAERWPDLSQMPGAARILRDHMGIDSISEDDVRKSLAESYARPLY